MSMENEWKELKGYVSGLYGEQATMKVIDILRYMENLERRSLPERVADLLCNAFPDKVARDIVLTRDLLDVIAKALRTGDTTKLESWSK